MVIYSLLQNKKEFKELVSNLFSKIDDLGLGMITISEFENHFNDEALLHHSNPCRLMTDGAIPTELPQMNLTRWVMVGG